MKNSSKRNKKRKYLCCLLLFVRSLLMRYLHATHTHNHYSNEIFLSINTNISLFILFNKFFIWFFTFLLFFSQKTNELMTNERRNTIYSKRRAHRTFHCYLESEQADSWNATIVLCRLSKYAESREEKKSNGMYGASYVLNVWYVLWLSFENFAFYSFDEWKLVVMLFSYVALSIWKNIVNKRRLNF